MAICSPPYREDPELVIELLALIAAIISFIVALLKAGEKPESILHMASNKFEVPISVIERILKLFNK